jgi:hypothetical protein
MQNAQIEERCERRCDDVGCASRGILPLSLRTLPPSVPFICLTSLVDDDENHGAEIIRFHLWISMAFRRLEEQLNLLAHAQPNYYSRRLLFGGCRCSKFGVFCDHPAVKELTRKTDYLRYCTT